MQLITIKNQALNIIANNKLNELSNNFINLKFFGSFKDRNCLNYHNHGEMISNLKS